MELLLAPNLELFLFSPGRCSFWRKKGLKGAATDRVSPIMVWNPSLFRGYDVFLEDVKRLSQVISGVANILLLISTLRDQLTWLAAKNTIVFMVFYQKRLMCCLFDFFPVPGAMLRWTLTATENSHCPRPKKERPSPLPDSFFSKEDGCVGLFVLDDMFLESQLRNQRNNHTKKGSTHQLEYFYIIIF